MQSEATPTSISQFCSEIDHHICLSSQRRGTEDADIRAENCCARTMMSGICGAEVLHPFVYSIRFFSARSWERF